MPEGTPTDTVIQYRQQGYPDDSIIQALQQQGYTSQQVFDAMGQADQKGSQTAAPQGMEQNYSDSGSGLNTEEIVESVVQEKWKEFSEKMRAMNEWRDKTETRLVNLEQMMSLLKENFDKLHEGVLGKIGEYDTNLKDVGSSIQAMDQVFKKVLPTLTESVNKLERLSK